MSAASKGKILLIEDDIALRGIYADTLAADGYTVVTAEDGERGLAMVRTENPDLVLLDLILPKLPGLEILKKIRADARTRNTIVLILSVMGEQRHIQKALDMGADGYTVKGSHKPNDVLAKIQKLIAAKPKVKEPVKVYNLFVKGDRGDATRLKNDTGAARLFICPTCNEDMQLTLIPDSSRSDGHWYSAHFTCPKCGKQF